MREQIIVLEELQRIDVELNELEVVLNEYPDKISGLEGNLESMKQDLQNSKTEIEQLTESKSSLESQIAQNEELIKKSEEKLFEIKTHKEYAALQKEIADTKRMNSELEEKLIEEMEISDQLDIKVKEKEEECTSKEEDYQLQIEEYKEKLDEIKSLYTPKKKQKDEITEKLNRDVLVLYQQIKKRTGSVIALAENEICSGCNMNIPAQLFNEILTLSRIIQCPSCTKILFPKLEAEEMEQVESEAKTA